MAGRRQLERLLEQRTCADDVDGGRAFAREREIAARSVLHRARLRACRARKRQGLAEVVSEELRMLGDAIAGDTLDPRCGGRVLVRTAGPRDLRVCNVADEPVAEGKFDLTLDRGEPRRTHEISTDQL